MSYDPCGSAAEETITRQELSQALARLGYSYSKLPVMIFQDAHAHREPAWRGGDVVKDSAGVVWVRAHSDKWLRPGNTGIYGDNSPKRPLKRLVEEV